MHCPAQKYDLLSPHYPKRSFNVNKNSCVLHENTTFFLLLSVWDVCLPVQILADNINTHISFNICVKHSLTFAHFGGWLAASFNDVLNVTARCSYELQLLSVDI